VTMRMVVQFYPCNEKDVADAKSAIKSMVEAISKETDYPPTASIYEAREIQVTLKGNEVVQNYEVPVVKVDQYLHFKNDAFKDTPPVE
jgi:hypothetical protein